MRVLEYQVHVKCSVFNVNDCVTVDNRSSGNPSELALFVLLAIV